MKKVVFISFVLFISLCLSAQQLPKGKGMFTFSEYAPFADRPVDVHYYIPPTGDLSDVPVIFVLEGADRGYAYLTEAWSKLAEERKFIFVLPHFDLDLYPLEDYQETGVLTPDRKKVREQSHQTSALIDEIFKYIRQHSESKAEKYNIYGHSAGGQFVHRFMLFYDSPYVQKAVVGCPGWYTFPDKEQNFPYGISDVDYIDQEAIKHYLAKDIVIQLGMADTVRESYLRKTPEAEMQGKNRLERGRKFYQYAQQLVAENNWPFHWRKEEVEGVGHHSILMGEQAIPILLNDFHQKTSNRFYPDPLKTYKTPTLSKHATEGIASVEEITAYLKRLVNNYPDKVSMTSIGKTTKDRDIPILYFKTEDNNKDKIKIWIQAGLHGNEPAGSESVCLLAEYLLSNEDGRQLLSHFNIALIPIANVDGYAVQERKSALGLDLNRDQTKLTDPVSVFLKEAFIKWNPEVALDIHEYRPWREEYNVLTGKTAGVYEDVLFLPTGHLNVPFGIRDFSLNVLQKNAEGALSKNGYSHGYYFTPNIRDNQVWLSKGARSPQSSSTNFALSNAISMFVEIRGIGLERTSFARRAESGFIVASDMLQTCFIHKDRIKEIISQAIDETIKGKNDVYVSFKSKATTYTARFVDAMQTDTFSITLPAVDATECEPILTRKRPKAYILSDTCVNAVRILQTLGVEVERTTAPLSFNVEQYVVTNYEESPVEWENIYPVRVKTKTEEVRKKAIPTGWYIVALNQKNANYVTTLLEPESVNGFINFRVLNVNSTKEVPVYRVR